MKTIKFCTLHDAGGRLILTIPKSIFGDQAHIASDLIRKKIFPSVHNGSYPVWMDRLEDSIQVEFREGEKVKQFVDLLEKWIPVLIEKGESVCHD